MSDDKNRKRDDEAPDQVKTKKAKVSWWEQYWRDFGATENDDWNDGEQTCGAKLHYITKEGVKEFIVGVTGKSAGHAEMHALDQFIKHMCDNNPANLAGFKERGLAIECTAKACCLRCSIILGALGFSAAKGTPTFKSTKSMGKTQWGLVPNTRMFVRAAVGMTEEQISYISIITNL